MPRLVESHHLEQRVPDPQQARVHLCGPLLLIARGQVGAPVHFDVEAHADAGAAHGARQQHLTSLRRTGFHLVTQQRFTISAVAAAAATAHPEPVDAAFQAAWARTWEPALEQLQLARAHDEGQPGEAVLLPQWERYTNTTPWGPALRDALQSAPHALHAASGTLLVGVGAQTALWLRTYYASVLEKAPAALPAHPGDTEVTYTVALGVWQPELDGPLTGLQEALATARNITAS